MTKTMKAAVVRDFGKPLTIEEAPVPEVLPGTILVKVEACGVCHTDLHAMMGDWPVMPKPPFIPGHEGVGHVVAVGQGVKNVREGDRVGVPWLYSACGFCEHCWVAGKLCASSSKTPAIRSMALSRNMCWPTRTMLDICRKRWISSASRRCSALV